MFLEQTLFLFCLQSCFISLKVRSGDLQAWQVENWHRRELWKRIQCLCLCLEGDFFSLPAVRGPLETSGATWGRKHQSKQKVMQNLLAETLIKVNGVHPKSMFMCQCYNTKYFKLLWFALLPRMLSCEWSWIKLCYTQGVPIPQLFVRLQFCPCWTGGYLKMLDFSADSNLGVWQPAVWRLCTAMGTWESVAIYLCFWMCWKII